MELKDLTRTSSHVNSSWFALIRNRILQATLARPKTFQVVLNLPPVRTVAAARGGFDTHHSRMPPWRAFASWLRGHK
jgi:hypothetical protein